MPVTNATTQYRAAFDRHLNAGATAMREYRDLGGNPGKLVYALTSYAQAFAVADIATTLAAPRDYGTWSERRSRAHYAHKNAQLELTEQLANLTASVRQLEAEVNA